MNKTNTFSIIYGGAAVARVVATDRVIGGKKIIMPGCLGWMKLRNVWLSSR